MSGEYQSTVTGGKIVEVVFTPGFREYKVTGMPVPECLGQVAHQALLLERAAAELAAAREQIQEMEAERDELRAAEVPAEASIETAITAAGDVAGELCHGDEIVIARREEEPEVSAPVLVVEEDPVSAASEALVVAPPAEGEAEPPTPETPAPPPPVESVSPQEKTRRISQIAQAEIIREIVMHPNFTHSGRLEGHNISAILRNLVQGRTGMSDKQWSNTYTALRIKKFITLRTYADRPKLAYAAVIDFARIAAAIRQGDLFAGDEEADKTFKGNFLKTADVKAGESSTADDESPKFAPKEGVSPVHTRNSPQVTSQPAPAVPAAKPPSRPSVAAPLPKSGSQLRQERYERKQREEAEAARRPVARRSSPRLSDDMLKDAEAVLPEYAEIGEAEWEAMKNEDETKFLLALTHPDIEGQRFETSAEVLSLAVDAGRIKLQNEKGEHDLQKLPGIIKSLKNGSQPKISFENTDGKLSLELTELGREYLATQLRRIRQSVIRATEPQDRRRRSARAA